MYYEAEKPYLDEIVNLYEEHFSETDDERRAEIYSEINRVAQIAAEYAVPNEIDKIYNSMGGTGLNAHTWYEETVYKIGLPSNRLKQWAEIESDRFVNHVFRLFHTALETVYEEKNRAMDNTFRVMFEEFFRNFFKKHPYGQQTVLGTKEHLKNPSIKKMKEYYDSYYIANNMTLMLSGNFDQVAAKKYIESTFGRLRSGKNPVFVNVDEDSFN